MALAHDGLRFALASAPALIPSAKGDDVRRGLVAGFYSSVLVGLHIHHHGEDELLFPLLIDEFPEERHKVDLGATQHHEVASAVPATEEAIARWGTDGDAEMDELLSSLRALEEVLAVHLEYEQREVVPLEARLRPEVRAAYWARTVDHHRAQLPPDYFFSISRCQALLWEAVGEAAFRDMVGQASLRR